MSSFLDESRRSYKAAAALAKYLRVKIDSQEVVSVAGATDESIGSTEQAVFAADQHVSVRLKNCEGSRMLVANGAISVGDYVYAAAAGKVSGTGYLLEGRANQAASADGDIIEVLNIQNGPDCVATVA